MGMMNVDEVIQKHVGGFGRWQRFIVFLMACYSVLWCLVLNDMIFITARTSFKCKLDAPKEVTDALSDEQLYYLTNPVKSDGNMGSCYRYSYNWSSLVITKPKKAHFDHRTRRSMGTKGHDHHVHTSSSTRTTSSVTIQDLFANGAFVEKYATIEECSHFQFENSTFTSTIYTEWNLVCKNSYLLSTIRSVSMAGMMIGFGVAGFLTDRFGRRRTAVMFIPLAILSRIGVTFSPNIICYSVFNFFALLTSKVIHTAFCALAVELVGSNWRRFASTIFSMAFIIGYHLMTLIAYFIRSWKLLSGVYTAIFSLSAVYIIFIPESPSWHLSKGHKSQCLKVLRQLSERNGYSFPGEPTFHICGVDENESKNKIWHHLLRKKWALRFILLTCAWVQAMVLYYGLTLNMDTLPESIYSNMITAGSLELYAHLISELAVIFPLSRRSFTTRFYMVAGLFLLLLLTYWDVPKGNDSVTSVCMLGRLCSNFAYFWFNVWTKEMLPTSVRKSGMSMLCFLSNIGVVLVPFIEHLRDIHPLMPMVTIGGGSLIFGLLLLFLPDTKRIPQLEISESFNDQGHCKELKCEDIPQDRNVTTTHEDLDIKPETVEKEIVLV